MWSERSISMAKWIVRYDFALYEVTCSVCGAREDEYVRRGLYGGGDWSVDGDSKFCPTCGSRMTGKIYEYWGDDADKDEDADGFDDSYDFGCSHCVYGNTSGKMSGIGKQCRECFLESEHKEGQPMCNGHCRYCTIYECRCRDCFALSEMDGKWYCDEYEEYCENITACGEFDDPNIND